MLVRTGAVDLHYLTRSMNTFNPLAMITSAAIVIKRYLRVMTSFAEFFWMARCLLVRKSVLSRQMTADLQQRNTSEMV
jgi:hypothetical protein